MRYSLSNEELEGVQVEIAALPTGSSNLDDPAMAKSTSEWDQTHLDALRAVSIDDLPFSRFFDAQFIPADEHPGYSKLASHIGVPKADDLRSFTREYQESLFSNRFLDLFSTIAVLSTSRPFNPSGTLDQRRNPSPNSELSASSDEDKPAYATRSCASALIRPVIQLSISNLCSGIHFDWHENDCTTFVRIGTTGKAESLSDGAIVISGAGTYTGTNRLGRYPIVNIEAKRRHAGGLRHSTAEPEQYSPELLAQEVGEMLGQVMANCEQVYGLRQWREQEAWAITMHGTELRFVTAYFRQGYLSCVNSPAMPPNEQLVVFRSAPADLKTVGGRLEALRYMIALVQYLRSGRAQIALLQRALQQLS